MHKLLFSAITSCALAASPVAFAQAAAGSSSPSSGANHGSSPMHESMMSGMQKMQGMQPTGNPDKDFAAMMRMHHQQAVEMAQAELQHGKSAELKKMAQKMAKDQQKEIAQLDQWLAKNK